MKISNEVADVLANSTIDGNKLYLPGYQLERKLYVSVNKVLENIKGKWNRSAKAHIFNECPSDIIDDILITGEYTNEKKEYQFFETPIELAKKLVSMAAIQEGETVLEPSAGRGRIASLIPECSCVELNEDNRKYLYENNFNVIAVDFLGDHINNHDIIIANPPFSKQQDIDHVNKMIDIANRKVVSIMSASVLFRTNKKTNEFRERVKNLGGTFEMLPDNSFVASGTKANTCIVSIPVAL